MSKNKSDFILGQLLTGRQSYDWLLTSISLAPPCAVVNICSAFIKYPAMRNILNECPKSDGRVLVRWQKFDLFTGSSDLSIYKLLKDRGWKLYIDTRFHGKVYAIPTVGILMGSANATNTGFSITEGGGREVCTILPEGESAADFIDELFSYSTLVDDNLFALLTSEYESIKNKVICDEEWSPEIADKLTSQVPDRLLVCDFFSSNPEILSKDTANFENDLELLGIKSLNDISESLLKKKILKIKSIAWILKILANYPEGIFYGELTALLHNAMIEDPTPYRSTVKALLTNAIGWLNTYCPNIIICEKPNYSQRIRLCT